MKLSLIYLEQTGSTNTYLRELAAGKEASEGTVVWTRQQTMGRGQGKNTWYSAPGMNLTFSILLEPRFMSPYQQFFLNKAVSLAILDLVKKELPSEILVSVKWPNDIYAGHQKIAGILIEHTVMGNTLSESILGIGINVNEIDFPETLPNPVSMRLLTGKEYELEAILELACEKLIRAYDRLRTGDFAEISKEFDAALYGIGKRTEFKTAGYSFRGMVSHVDDSGRLAVNEGNGEKHFFNHGEVSFADAGSLKSKD